MGLCFHLFRKYIFYSFINQIPQLSFLPLTFTYLMCLHVSQGSITHSNGHHTYAFLCIIPQGHEYQNNLIFRAMHVTIEFG